MDTISTLLLPELESEFTKTRKFLAVVPDGHNDFKPHEKSMAFMRLTGHLAELPDFITTILTSPDLDLGQANFAPFRAETAQQAIAYFDEVADKAITTVKGASDELFHQTWTLTWGPHPIFHGIRYAAYREMGLNHIVHHRAQLGVYLRELNVPIPGCYGPSADEM